MPVSGCWLMWVGALVQEECADRSLASLPAPALPPKKGSGRGGKGCQHHCRRCLGPRGNPLQQGHSCVRIRRKHNQPIPADMLAV